MKLLFEDHLYNNLLVKVGISATGYRLQFLKVLIPFIICWLPLAFLTLINGTFWTGEITTSFITNFDTQARFLISMPLLIISVKLVSSKLGLILNQFINSGIIFKEDRKSFESMIDKQVRFLNSNWTNLTIILICYLQVFAILFYESTHTSFLTWQLIQVDGEPTLNLVGKWCTLVSKPIVLYLLYKWLLRIIVWGNILRKISNFKLNLFPEHPDLSGGLGFLGYVLRYFSPITFAISAVVAGNMADFILIEGLRIADMKLPALGYFIFITLLFTLPMFTFTSKMINAREGSVFENYDFANGMYIELRTKISKAYDKVSKEDLDSSVYSSVSDYNMVVENVLKMKFLPYTLKDLVPLWFTTALPFLAVVLLEIPFVKIFENVLTILV